MGALGTAPLARKRLMTMFHSLVQSLVRGMGLRSHCAFSDLRGAWHGWKHRLMVSRSMSEERSGLRCFTLERAVIICALAGYVVVGAAQQPALETFTSAQAVNGKAGYDRRCAECHGTDLRGSAGPALAGPNFLNAWGQRSTRDLLAVIKSSMPPGAVGSLMIRL